MFSCVYQRDGPRKSGKVCPGLHIRTLGLHCSLLGQPGVVGELVGGWSAPLVGVGGTDHPQALPTLRPLSAPTMVYLEYAVLNIL